MILNLLIEDVCKDVMIEDVGFFNGHSSLQTMVDRLDDAFLANTTEVNIGLIKRAVNISDCLSVVNMTPTS